MASLFLPPYHADKAFSTGEPLYSLLKLTLHDIVYNIPWFVDNSCNCRKLLFHRHRSLLLSLLAGSPVEAYRQRIYLLYFFVHYPLLHAKTLINPRRHVKESYFFTDSTYIRLQKAILFPMPHLFAFINFASNTFWQQFVYDN